MQLEQIGQYFQWQGGRAWHAVFPSVWMENSAGDYRRWTGEVGRGWSRKAFVSCYISLGFCPVCV